ncbi:alpha/beta hydrolase fold domain-containing protein [Pontiella sulfatireligans]|uniref:Carboxylesterase NlhH n=1 Tax=Pontiella sulfatireligans TaxID=2750658 RepID=A0A6C2UPP4_9BACT|nr:alpha/beta hydrolase fold domain-containing protein [Pontiella sulfatireligans]VGO22262.1 Carboxylesterase NlhH [Pontiella sulfatireligans]
MKTMLKTGLCFAAFLFILSPLSAQQQFTYDRLLERNDQNNDGVVTQDEFRGNPQMFDRMDADKDGKATRAEFDAAMKARRGRQRQGDTREQSGNRFATQGLQPGQKIPELTVYDLDGKEVKLSTLWKNKPAVLVTASATCPISVGSCPSLKPLSGSYSSEVNVAVLYVKEAHPAEDGQSSPGRTLGARTHPQPQTFEEKLALAQLFDQKIDHGNALYVDGLERTAANTLGAGPNIGLLIDRTGKIVLRQGWYNANGMEAAINELNEKAAKPQRQYRQRQLPENITAHRDLEYSVEDGESLQLDLYLPEAKNPPLMVWIHGGGWKNGDKANVNPAILRLSGEGYAVASINYRLKDLSIHPKNIHDCKGAVRWLRAHAAEYGYDPERVAVGGGSAGGHLSLLLGMSSGVQELEGTVGGNTNQSSTVKAIVDLYGPSDFSAFSKTSERFNKAHEFRQEQLTHASPLTYLSKDDPPVLILHGDQDKTVPVEQSKLLHERYQKAGLTSELHIIKGAGHGGMVFSDEERYQLIKAFLDQHLAE